MPPLFSAVVCNYNYGRFLSRCVDSVLGQAFPGPERELIIVDDGSTDDSLERLRPYEGRLTLLRQENQGQGAAFAAGFAAARGAFVCLLDADDYWHPDKLAKTAAALDASGGAAIAQHYLRDVDKAERPLPNPLPAWPPRYRLEDFLDGRCEDAATTGLTFRRDLLLRLLPVPRELFAFYDEYLLAHGLFESPIVNIPEVLGYHRVHGKNNWALRHEDPARLEWFLRQYRTFLESVTARGVELTARHKELVALEEARCRVLAAAQCGRRGEAFAAWRGLFRDGALTPHRAFRAATLGAALLSPRLYLALYRLYGARHGLSRLRRRLLPDS